MVKTVNDAVLDLARELRLKGISGSLIEARELVCTALDIEPEKIDAHRGAFVFDAQLARIRALRDERLSGVPVQHLTGRWEFFGLPLEVSRETLIPRADTETLAQSGIEFLQGRGRSRMLDLCCGTGCIGIAILKHCPEVSGVLADLSQPALQIARRNLLRHNLTGRGLTLCLDALAAPNEGLGKFQLIVCNPPYIPSAEIDTLDAEVRHEPRMALDGGEDGLRFYHAIAEGYSAVLSPDGALMFEVGLGEDAAVLELMDQLGYRQLTTVKDIPGVERVVKGLRPND